jgi:hypothetical protein
MPVRTTLMPAGEDGVEQGRVLAVPVADQVLHRASLVFEVHHEVAGGLGHPRRARVRSGAEDPDTAAGVFDDREDVQPGAGERDRREEVRGQQRVGLRTQELCPGGSRAVRGGIDSGFAQGSPRPWTRRLSSRG